MHSHIVRGIVIVALVCTLVVLFGTAKTSNQEDQLLMHISDHKNATYRIDGEKIPLFNGVSEIEIVPGGASKKVTRYFGNELRTDLNNDGQEDVVFLLTQTQGGSGTFFYVVAALKTNKGYVGSDAVLLGDRIAPQNIELTSPYTVVVNYADRAQDESFAVAPSIGKSIKLRLDPNTMQWGEVVQDFEGEADLSREDTIVGDKELGTITGVVTVGPTCPVERIPPDPACADLPLSTELVLQTADTQQSIRTFTSNEDGTFTIDIPQGAYVITQSENAPIFPRCAPSDLITVVAQRTATARISCDTGIR